jgi:hypothetical protein
MLEWSRYYCNTSCTYSCEEVWHMVFAFLLSRLWAYFISVLYMLHMCRCERVLDIMFFFTVSILYYPVIHLAHSSEWVFRHVFSQSYHNIWLFCYTSCEWLCPATRKIQLLRTFFYNRINLGLHPSLYINTISTHYHLHFMLLSCVNLSISIQQSSQELLQLLFKHQ